MLEIAGWSIQDVNDVDFTASRGVALREFPLKAGFADYMLFVDRQAVGIVEAKKEGTTLSGVDTQSKKYLEGLPAHVQRVGDHSPLPTRARAWRQCSATCEILITAPGGCSRFTVRGRSWDGHKKRRRSGHA